MAKRKIVRAATNGKASGTRTPKKPPLEKWQIPNEQSLWPHVDGREHDHGGITYKQQLYIDEYVDNGGNGLEAYLVAYPGVTRGTAKQLAYLLNKKEHIADAIETKREEIRRLLNITREKLLRVQAAMALTTIDQCTEVFNRPGDKDSYRNLGDKRFAIKSIQTKEFGNELTMIDRQVALNELWKKLGFKEGIDPASGSDDYSGIHADVIELFRKRAEREGR